MFEFRHDSLRAESVALEAIASEFGTPCYVYSRADLAKALNQFQSACGEHAVREGDLLATMSAGATAMCMGSNYNSRPRAAEVMADGTRTIWFASASAPKRLLLWNMFCVRLRSLNGAARRRLRLNRTASVTLKNELSRPRRQRSPG